MFINHASGASQLPSIDHSLRFWDWDSEHLYRTPGTAGNRKTFTISMWIKRCRLGNNQFLWSAYSDANNRSYFYILASGQLEYRRYISSTLDAQILTTEYLLDPTSWYHVLLSQDATNTVAKIYINGIEAGYNTSNQPSNIDGVENNTVIHNIGKYEYPSDDYFDGYMSRICFVDGSALTPSSFTYTDSNDQLRTLGAGACLSVVEAGGVNSFMLDFQDGTSNTTLGYDLSSKNCDWTVPNHSRNPTNDYDEDWVLDTPTNNFPTLISYDASSNMTCKAGSLHAKPAATAWTTIAANIELPSTGKWYYEYTIYDIAAEGYVEFGLTGSFETTKNNHMGAFTAVCALLWTTGTTINLYGTAFRVSSTITYANTLAPTDVIGVAYDADNDKLYFSHNNTWLNSGDPAGGTGYLFSGLSGIPFHPAISAYTASEQICINFGQQPLAYTPPSGFITLSPENLPEPSIIKPKMYFDVDTYTGTGSSLERSTLNFQPNLTWIKCTSTTADHAIYDSVRGAQSRWEANQPDAQVTSDGGITSFDSDGYTLGTLAQVNTNTATYVSWNWKESTVAGLDIVQYSGDDTSNRNISHNLGDTPEFAIVKRLDASEDAFVWSWYTTNTTFFKLNTTAAAATASSPWGTGNWTSTQFMVTNNATNNTNATGTNNYIAYLFASVPGYMKTYWYNGSYTYHNSYVHCGFKPAFIMIKCVSAAYGWVILDFKRSGSNVAVYPLFANTTAANGASNYVTLTSTGFKIKPVSSCLDTDYYLYDYIFIAFAESPFKYSNANV